MIIGQRATLLFGILCNTIWGWVWNFINNDDRTGLRPLGWKMKVRLSDINVASLNSRTIILLKEFMRVARTREGFDLQMQQPDLIRQIFLFGTKTSNPDLIVLFMRIKLQMIRHLHKLNLANDSSASYHKVA